MAMNKAEKERMGLLELELKLLSSFKLSAPVLKDLMPPASYSDGLSKGWDFNSYNGEVFKACSSSIGNGTGWDKTTSQNSKALFSTRKLALMALRYATERELLIKLSKIDEDLTKDIYD